MSHNPDFILKYGYDSCVVIEETHGEMDHRYLARLRDGGGFGSGHTPAEAIQSLVLALHREAEAIQKAAADWTPN